MTTSAVAMPPVLVREDSAVFALAVEHYVRHGVPAFADRCHVCREPGCPVRHHAAEVIRAAGVDPRRYDPPPRRAVATAWTSAQTRLLPMYGAPSPREGPRS